MRNTIYKFQATGFGFSIKLTAELFIIKKPYKNFQ